MNAKQAQRMKLNEDIKRFLAGGGEINHVAPDGTKTKLRCVMGDDGVPRYKHDEAFVFTMQKPRAK